MSTYSNHFDLSERTEVFMAAAVAAVDRGWPLFVLGRSKRPVANCARCRAADPSHDRQACGCLTCHGFYAATLDPARIAAMLAAVPGGLLAVRTGAPSGLVVVDIDPRHGGRLDPALMPPTLGAATGGGGWHLYYRHPGIPVVSRALPGRDGVDIKADGGYVVLSPSVHPDTGQAYRWLPAPRPVIEMPPALRGLVLTAPTSQPEPSAPPTESPAPRPIPTGNWGRGISSPDALLAATLATVRTAPKGRRRATLYGAARGLARMVAAGALTRTAAVAALTDAGHAAQQTERDIHAAITGGFRDEGVPA
ncbi:bifunctional DNA primase/polymerase [Pseudonocardia sp. ICBG1142]|uniref:bifunctional DNA primase/polymerase n=1 Tax=Pseudonocardia sp. ICBG1142 TaxID=2846760 RepID=UPI001CF6C855|nr:bifunctional DNA primase/polymerase [Pseudonocardia sp. ICBG1142]